LISFIQEAYAINAGNLVHVLWEDDTPGNSDILYRRDGADFDPTTINLGNNAGFSGSPAAVVSSNNVHVGWHDNTSGNLEVLYRRSTDGGATFGPTINLSMNPLASSGPTVAVTGSSVYVLWVDNTTGINDILYRMSTNGGTSFVESAKNLSSDGRNSVNPAIGAAGNNVHVTWQDNFSEILYRKSINEGNTFPNIIKNSSSNTGSSFNPSIAAIARQKFRKWMIERERELLRSETKKIDERQDLIFAYQHGHR
jgi:hypothetical protein